ncbi:MAG: CcdB family protein [Rhodoferax sp.]|nr:CcdB family protein [Rhodoferax sp.]
MVVTAGAWSSRWSAAVRCPEIRPPVGSRLNPVFHVAGVQVVLHPLDMVSVAVDQLGQSCASLSGQGQAISGALDELLTRSCG